MTVGLHSCPEDPRSTADRYLFGLMPARERADFEEHFLACPRCSERLQFTDRFIEAYRRAAERMSLMNS
jgi:hypothetical protein